MENNEALTGLAALVTRLADLVPPAQSLVVASCFILGLILAFSAIRGFVNASENRGSFYPPLTAFVVAVLLVSLSQTISAFLMSLFQVDQTVASSEIFAYAPELLAPVNNEQAKQIIIALLRVVQFIGLLGFIRGLFMLNKSVSAPKQGLAAFGTTHLIAGILAMNIVMFVGMIEKLILG